MGDAAATARHSPPASATPDAPRPPSSSSRPRVVSDENDAGHLRFHLRSPLRPRSSPGGGAAAKKGGIQMMDSPSPGRPAGSADRRGDTDDCAAPNRGCAELRAALDDVAAALAAGGGAAPGGGGVASTRPSPPADVVPDSEAASPVKLAAAPVAQALAAEAAEAAAKPTAEAATPPPPTTSASPPPSPPADGPMDPADAEARYLGAYIAAVLPGDPAAAGLARATPAALAAGLSNGVLLCRLLAATSPAAGVDDRAVNVPRDDGTPLPRDEALQNVAMALDAARAAGAALPPTLTPPPIVDADAPAPALDAAWAVAWLALSAPLSVAARPATLAVLRAPGEDAARFVAAPATTLLLRWVNHHLGACGAAWGRPPVEDLSGDLVDSAAWAALAAALRRARVASGADPAALPPPPALDSLPPLRRLQAGFADLDARRADLAARAAAVHPSLAALAPPTLPLPPPAALAAGSPRVGAAMLASLFAAGDALDGAGSADAAEVARALEDGGGGGGDGGESRDDRTLRVWVASIVGVPPSAPEFLAALREGHLLLKAVDALSPGCVDWKKAHAPPFKPLLARPRSIENANQAVDIARRLSGLPLVNVSGEDIVNGARKQAAALLWQLCRLHVRKLLAEATGGVPADKTGAATASTNRAADAALDAEVVAWANARVAAAGGRRRAASLHDRSLATGLFLLDLLAAVAPASVNPALVSPGRTAREKECNARYAIAAARKLGVSLPLLPEDLADASPRAALIFMAALMLFDKKAQG